MNFRHCAILLILIVSVALCEAQNEDGLSETKKRPAFSWDKMPLYMHLRKNTTFTKDEIQFLAKYTLITFEKTTGSSAFGSTEKGTIEAAKAVKAINPKSKILYYKNVVINWGTYKEDELFLSEHSNALLTNDIGEKALMPNGRTDFFDISEGYVHDYWVNHVSKVASNPYVDGLFLDANIKALVPGFFISRVGKEKQQKLMTGYHMMMDQLKTRLGKDNLLIANIIRVRPEFQDEGRTYLKYFDGSYIEGFEHENFGMSYADYLAKGIEAVQKSAREGNVIAMSLGIGEALKNANAGIDDARKSLNENDDLTKRLIIC
ncbi:putative glycoside hydrolase [uncultured Polaribacter sp.]|uniref:putative glycoside hydrolase n=1 Tax=uncultured Polaribacter sp. TaxID=174711 RepID=UPI0026073042|nr:putative glycoside hydrolase [uncultured Polaribacter sp.]